VVIDTVPVESCYQNADEFIPERWYSQPEMIKNKVAFAPFSLGMDNPSVYIACVVD
jgi:hypothetical protein